MIIFMIVCLPVPACNLLEVLPFFTEWGLVTNDTRKWRNEIMCNVRVSSVLKLLIWGIENVWSCDYL